MLSVVGHNHADVSVTVTPVEVTLGSQPSRRPFRAVPCSLRAVRKVSGRGALAHPFSSHFHGEQHNHQGEVQGALVPPPVEAGRPNARETVRVGVLLAIMTLEMVACVYIPSYSSLDILSVFHASDVTHTHN